MLISLLDFIVRLYASSRVGRLKQTPRTHYLWGPVSNQSLFYLTESPAPTIEFRKLIKL